MNLHDPARPLLAPDRPAYCDADGNAIAAMPVIHMTVGPDGICKLFIMVKTSPSGYSWVEGALPPHQIPPLLEDWQADPERVMRDFFNYTPSRHPAAKLYEEIDIGELGL